MHTALDSHYIIDGVPQEFTPAELLDAISDAKLAERGGESVVDETVDPSIEQHDWNPAKLDWYVEKVMSAKRRLPLPFAGAYSRGRVASALLDALWLSGHFRMEDLALEAAWTWNCGPVGASAALYDSVQQATEYLDALGVGVSTYSFAEGGDNSVSFKAVLSQSAADDDDIFGPASRAERPRLGTQVACPRLLDPDPQSWLVYVPFDTADYRLGGSLLAQSLSLGGGVCPQVTDADYFIDCYEVVRELVEDGIVISGTTVWEGGLLAAVKRLCEGGPGISLDLSDALRAADEDNAVRLLFAEVPGVLIQVRDNDYDYIDAEFLLQDVAFFPLGHPNVKSSAVRVKTSAKTTIQTILESLMQNAEGED